MKRQSLLLLAATLILPLILSAKTPRRTTTGRATTPAKTTPAKKTQQHRTPAASATSTKLNRHVLYTLRADEELCTGECNVGFKANDMHYAAIIYNKKLKKYYLVVDGVKKIVADEILCQYLDPVDFDNSIYQYIVDSKAYTFIEGRSFTPTYSTYPRISGAYTDTESDWVNKGLYGDNSGWYDYGVRLSDSDASNQIDYSIKNTKSVTLKSNNLKHMAIQDGFCSIYVDGRKWTTMTTYPQHDAFWCNTVLYDDGTCVLNYTVDNTEYSCYVIKDGSITKVGDDEYFNYRLCKIVPEEVSPTVNSFSEVTPYAPGWWRHNEVRLLHDKTGKHTLETSGLYKYVLIDNQPYGKECALGVWYDPTSNEFRWTAIEQKNIVLYTYKL